MTNAGRAAAWGGPTVHCGRHGNSEFTVKFQCQPGSALRVTSDPEADAAYISFAEAGLMPGRDRVPVDPPTGMQAFVVMD